nr:hypothetical protein BaRGS_029209 [Batillaria attramentaria]
MDITEELPKLKSMLTQAMGKMEKWTGEEKQNIIQLEEKSSRLKALRQELTLLTQTVDGRLHEKELVSQELDQTHLSVNKERDRLSGQEKVMEDKLQELNRAVDLFRDRLGLTFKKTSGNRLQMVFTNIDHKDPSSPFYFFVQVEDGKYHISDCEPAIPDLDTLVDKLNKTNNLRSFVVAVRKRFKKLVEQK